jgi:predicted anti-sigma-YlaC factor YlaD
VIEMSTVDDLPCRDVVELVTDYLELALPEPLRRCFEEHLEICDGCRLYLGQMRLSIRALRARPERSMSFRGREQLLEQYREWKRRSADP